MNENVQMDGMMSVISGIKNRGLSSTSVGNLAPTADIPELDDSEWRMDREWTAVVVEEDDCSWRKEEEEDEFAAYSPAQQKILRQAKSTFKRLDAVCFEAGKALAWYSVMHSNLVEFFTTLVDTHDTWTDIYEVSHHHLEPDRPAAQALQQAIRRLADLERWRRIATAWVLDACHKLDPFYNRLKEMVLQQQIKMEALKNLYSQECDLDDPSDVLTYGLESLTLEIEENVQFPKVGVYSTFGIACLRLPINCLCVILGA